MTIPTKKLKNGFAMPVYGFGTWGMGGKYEQDPDNDDSADIAAIKTAIDLGITHFDTAELYAAGYSEILLGEAIKNYDRSKLFLTSKVYLNHLAYDQVIKSAQASLKRLETNYLDLYLVHMWEQETLKDTMRALDTLVEEGLIKHIGIANYTVEEIQEAQSYTQNKIFAAQLHLNLKYREAEKKGVVKYCQENDIMFIAWRPVQKGVLLHDIPPVLQEMADKYQKTPAQIALNWLISQENVVTLSKTRSIEHLKENLGAVDWIMEKEDVEKLRNEFPDQEAVSDAVPLH